MARVVVIGGGPAGMAVAARLGKQRHDVVLCERADALGGAIRPVRSDGWQWDGGPATTTVPAVLRDLFRKSGRPLERELVLQPVTSPRRHHFDDGTVLDLPPTGRAAQTDALTAVLGARAAERWTALVDEQAEVWEVLRRRALEVPFAGCGTIEPSERRRLRQRLSLQRLARRALPDTRLRTLLQFPTVLNGSDPRAAPAYVAVEHYLERTFGIWRPDGGMAALLDALTARLATRRVDVRLGASATAIHTSHDRVNGVVLADGTQLTADHVVAAIDPRSALSLAGNEIPRWLQGTTPAVPPAVTHLALDDEAPDLPFESVLHGDPLLVVRREQPRTCTILARGAVHEDVLVALTRRGLDLRGHVRARVDRSPTQIVQASGGSPYGVAWRGARTVAHRPLPGTPIEGVHCIGASAHPGPGLALVGLGAAQCAAVIGPG